MRHLISRQYFATRSNYLSIMSHSPSNPIGYSRSTGTSMVEAKWIVLKHEEVSQSARCLRGYPRIVCCPHTSCTPGILNDYTWPIQEHWFPATRTTNLENARGTEEQINREEEFFTVYPDTRVREASKLLNGLPNRPKSNVAASMRLSREHGMYRKELFDHDNLFLRLGASPSQLLMFQGTSFLELVE